jgi:hypothetical protein
MDKYSEISTVDIDNILKDLPKNLISIENLDRLINELENDLGMKLSNKKDTVSILKQFLNLIKDNNEK